MLSIISLVITVLVIAIICYCIYWVVLKINSYLPQPIQRWFMLAFFVIVLLILLALLTGQIPIPTFFKL